MIRKTKQDLIERNEYLTLQLKKSEETIRELELKLKSIKELTVGGMTSSLVISAERIADAAAHLVADALRRR